MHSGRPALSRVKKSSCHKNKPFRLLVAAALLLVRSYLNELSRSFHQCAGLVDFLAGLFAGLPEEFAGKAIYNGQYRAQPAEHGKGQIRHGGDPQGARHIVAAQKPRNQRADDRAGILQGAGEGLGQEVFLLELADIHSAAHHNCQGLRCRCHQQQRVALCIFRLESRNRYSGTLVDLMVLVLSI